jgi:uncharacterized protein
MSRVLVVSDSHGLTLDLVKIKDKHIDDVQLMIHCGDSELNPNDKELEGFMVVGGNCDFDGEFPEETFQEVDGKKIWVTHGHHYGVKSTIMNLSYRAEELGANIICFGHSHLLGAEMINGKLFLNPGSIRLPRLRREKTYCILDIKGDKVTLNVYDINLGLLPELNHEFIIKA